MKTFNEFDLVAPLEQALEEMEFHLPTPIQQKAIPPAIQGKDVLGCAQTGTGKTAAFVLPIMNRLAIESKKASRNCPNALILAPTRELVVQIGECLASHGRHLRLRHTLVYGGVSQKPQARALKMGVHILAATPGRLLDLMNQGFINLSQLQMLVLDEVDRMLDMGFLPDIKKIVKEIPSNRQSLFFSATMPPQIKELTDWLLNDPVSVNISPKTPTVKKIKQQIILTENSRKQELLHKTLGGQDVDQVVVFTGTKRRANTITTRLQKSGFQAVAIHGNKSQNARQRALNDFQDRRFQVLVATDVAARGIDIEGITHVINFDLPKEPDSYVHRIGRTGRAGESGIAISFCSPGERRELRAIEKTIRQKIPTTQAKLGEKPTRNETSQSKSFKPHSPKSKRADGAHSGSGNQDKSKRKPSSRKSKVTRKPKNNGSTAGSPKSRRNRKSFGFKLKME